MKYYIPFFYFFNSRAKTIIHRASFVILIAFPIFWACFAAEDYKFNTENVMVFALGFIAMFSIYEVGYIYNDLVTTRFEEYPSMWFKEDMQNYLEKHMEQLVAVRVLISFALCVCISRKRPECIVAFAASLVGIVVVYSFHNTIRGRWNILTDGLLQVLKYCSLLLLVGNTSDMWKRVVIMLFTVPIERTIEFCRKERLNLTFFIKMDVSILRVVFHGTIAIISGVLFFVGIVELRFLMEISIVLLIYRIISLFLLKDDKVMKIRMKNFEKVQ